MSERVKRLLIAVVWLVIIFLATPQVVPLWHRVSFLLFSGFLFWIAQSGGIQSTIDQRLDLRISRGLLGVALILLLTTRLIPFLHWGEAPLGYDTGIYLRNFEQALAQGEMHPLSLIVYILSSAGFSVNAILHGFLIVFNILLGLSIYIMVQSVFRNRLVAVMALLIFTLSISQYEAYIWMFYRMMLALALFMITAALIVRRSYLAVLTGGFAGALHPATFLVFGLAYGVYTVVILFRSYKAKLWLGESVTLYTVLTGLGILALAFLVNFPEFRGYLPYLTQHKLQLASFDQFLSSELTGFYLNFTAFRASTLFYTPLALLGIWHIFRYCQSNLRGTNAKRSLGICPNLSADGIIFLFSLLLVSFGFIISKVVFYQRYLIILDLLVIIFAGITLARLIEYFGNEKWGRIVLGIFIVGFSGIILYYSWTRQPWIPPAELQELRAAVPRLEFNAYGMATDAYYTPWVYGYLTERTIAPGYFINYWSFEEWEKFWYKGIDEERVNLLARYGKDPIYIFMGSKQAENKPMRVFLENDARRVSEHLWRYQQ